MREGIERLARVVAAHLAEWEPYPPYVELAIYESLMHHSLRRHSTNSASEVSAVQ
jgi:hypothetical protein